jgi:hypothetical protein
LTLGHWLGTGGFAIVHEIKGICLDEPPEDGQEVCDVANGDTGSSSAVDPKVKDPSRQRPPSDEQEGGEAEVEAGEVRRVKMELRVQMEKRVLRNGVGRYAIKRLHNDLTVLEKARGRIDLAVEAMYLSVVHHPNIVRLRGVSSGNPLKPGYFLVMDRLYGTLDQRMNEWRKKQKECTGGFLGLGKKKSMLKDLLVDRMTVAYDLAAAFFYLHENR